MFARALAALLSLLLAASPVAAAERAVVPSLPTPTAPVVNITALNAVVPTLTVAPTLQLQQIADPKLAPETAGRRIDGAAEPKRAEEPTGSVPEIPQAPVTPQAQAPQSALQPSEPQQPQPPRKPAGFFRRLNAATGHTSAAERRFELMTVTGIAAGAVIPVALNIEPSLSAVINLPLALAGMVTVFGLATIGRAIRFIVTRKDPSPVKPKLGRMIAATALGLTLGAGMISAPWLAPRTFGETAMGIVDPGARARAVPGDALKQAVIEELSKNPVGRRVLDGLRDRFGVIRMPAFFIGDTKDAVARYTGTLDAVTVDISNLKASGWTPDKFFASPELQRRFAKEHASTFAHELEHAVQARRSPFEDGTLVHIMHVEAEYESYITEHFWAFEKLTADPNCEFIDNEMGNLLGPLEDLDGYLRETDAGYKQDIHLNSPRYKKWLAELRASWPAHRVETYHLLAERSRLKGQAAMAERYEKKAREIAAKNP